MGRIMAFDYGTKRIGIAVTDENQIIASPLDTIHPEKIIEFIKQYLLSNKIECFVVGLPRQMDNTLSESEKNITSFINRLNKSFSDITIERFDERFTSKMATQSILASGVNKKRRRDKELVDTVSATIILQSYLESKNI